MAFTNPQNLDRAGSNSARICDINTTPLVDVMLVLLIIFMITSPMLTHKTEARIPRITHGKTNVPAALLTVDILHSAGSIPLLLLESAPITLTDLIARMKFEARKRKAEVADVNLRTAPDASYQHMASVLALIKQSGIEKVRFDELNPPGLARAKASQSTISNH